MLTWIKTKVIGVFKNKVMRLLAEQSTRKALISLVVGVAGYQWTDGKIEAAGTLLGATYTFLSLIMEEKKNVPVTPPPLTISEPPIDASDSQQYVLPARKDSHINGQML